MTRRIAFTALTLALIVLCINQDSIAQTSFDGKLDIGALMQTAARQFDTSKLDAVLLADGMTVSLDADGRMSTTVHRIIRLNTDASVDKFGDTRIPFDQEHCTFTPLALRVWREGKWWNTDTSGFVETLPFALEHAYDYTGVREMMLLASSIEVPCILEMAYRIDDRTPFRQGADDLWLFARDEACAQSWFELRAPSGAQTHVSTHNGVPAAKSSTDQSLNLTVTRWQMGPLDGWPIPKPANLPAFAPCLIWSTWPSPDAVSKFAMNALTAEASVPGDVVPVLDSLKYQARSDRELAASIVSFVKDRVTLIDYPTSYWWSFPRSVPRVYETSYANRLDRTRLVASLLQRVGLTVTPTLLSDFTLPIGDQAASLSALPSIALRVTGGNGALWYYPASDRLESDLASQFGKSVMLLGIDSAPRVLSFGAGSLSIRLNLSNDKAKAKLLCSGLYEATGVMPSGFRSAMAAGGTEGYLSSLLSTCIAGVTATDLNFEKLDSAGVVLTFAGEVTTPNADPLGRTVFALGKPKEGAIDRLPGDVQIYRMVRTAPIKLVSTMNERTEVRLDTASCSVVRFPSDTTVQNQVGLFRISTKWHGTELVVVRELQLNRADIAAGDWPALRALLLAYGSDKQSRFYLKLPENSPK